MLGLWGGVRLARRASVNTARASGKPAVFTHISFVIAHFSEKKKQQELAVCWRLDRHIKPHGSAIVIDTRTEGSKGFGQCSVELLVILVQQVSSVPGMVADCLRVT